MSDFMLVRHNVEDFSVWKPAYDAHLPKRIEAGLSEKYVLQGADNPNEVVVLFEAKDLDRARAFADSADLRQTMEKAGITGKPDIYYLHQ